MPSAEKSIPLVLRFCSGRVASSLADGVHESHRLDPEADNRECAVIFTFLFCLVVYLLIRKLRYFYQFFKLYFSKYVWADFRISIESLAWPKSKLHPLHKIALTLPVL